jgi:hypothetical protein
VKVDENPKSHPTMIMCNPNGAAYETLFHDVFLKLHNRPIGQISTYRRVSTSCSGIIEAMDYLKEHLTLY